MENASKALLMAASILIGILILSLGVYLYINIATTAAQMQKENSQTQIDQYNVQYTVYENKKATIYDIITVANLAKDNNKYYGYASLADNQENNYYITVILDDKINSKKNIEWNDNNANDQLIQIELNSIQANQTLPTYNCTVTISETTQRVKVVNFVKE